ncbi:MAG: sensor histidine kinase, partial [Candidatus Hydrogenedentes bacterium]|nr:sensor histidine kinase [Candidatus Hydrogenedentota bacterium]
VEVRLTDQGSGLQPEARERLFQPFFTTKTTGTGLGLAICRRIVEAHGGTIALLDNPGGGTTVLLTFERLKQSDTTEGPLMAQGERA